jgi:hypothetical protein
VIDVIRTPAIIGVINRPAFVAVCPFTFCR